MSRNTAFDFKLSLSVIGLALKLCRNKGARQQQRLLAKAPRERFLQPEGKRIGINKNTHT